MRLFSKILVAMFFRHWAFSHSSCLFRTRRVLDGIAFLAVCLQAGAVVAAQIPKACSAQSPWGAPVWKAKEPPLTPICRTAYVALHDDSKLAPDFVSWSLT